MEEQRPAAARMRPSRWLRWSGSVVALLVLAGLAALTWHLTHPSSDAASGAAGTGARRPGGGRGAPPTTVGEATARSADIPIWLEALGTVTPSATVTVTPQVSGVLRQVLFQEGQMVRTGQLLAQIDARPFQMSLMQAQGQQLRDQAQLDNARLTLKRYRTLLEQDSIARQDVDTQAALVQQLEGTVMTDKANVGTAQINLDNTRITAPVAGRVGLRVVDVGNLVSSGDANGIAVITRLAPIDVEFSVPQDRVPDLEQRMAQEAALPVTALDRSRSNTLDTGRFLSLNNQIDTQTGTVRAKARFANAQRTLFPNQFVNVRVLLDTLRAAVVVPVTALRHGPEGDFVYVLNAERTVAVRKVVAGQSTVDSVTISAGLSLGERVVTEGGDRLKDGAHVMLPSDRPASGPGGRFGGASGARGAASRSGLAGSATPDGADGASRPHRRRASDASS